MLSIVKLFFEALPWQAIMADSSPARPASPAPTVSSVRELFDEHHTEIQRRRLENEQRSDAATIFPTNTTETCPSDLPWADRSTS